MWRGGILNWDFGDGSMGLVAGRVEWVKGVSVGVKGDPFKSIHSFKPL